MKISDQKMSNVTQQGASEIKAGIESHLIWEWKGLICIYRIVWTFTRIAKLCITYVHKMKSNGIWNIKYDVLQLEICLISNESVK